MVERMVDRLVGRRWELGALTELLDAARSGRGSGLLLLGDAGIGKTTLAHALAERAPDFTVGWGRCLETEATPYWAWRQANDSFGDAADDEVREPGASVRTHDDEIGLNRLRVLDNGVRDVTHSHRRDQRETSGRLR